MEKIVFLSRLVYLLPIISAECQETKLISDLNNYFGFDHNIFLVDSSADLNRFINNTQPQLTYIPQSVYVYKSVDRITLTKIQGKNPFLIVVPEHSIFNSNMELFIRVREIQRGKLDMKIGVFFLEVTTAADLQLFFQWCWSNRIIYIFTSHIISSAGERELNIFTFNPFGEFVVLNVTAKPYNNLFLSQNSNFQQHRFSVGINLTALLPTVRDETLRIWETILSLMNASYVQYSKKLPAPNSEMLRNGSVDVKPVPQVRHLDNTTYLYPLSFSTQKILVPQSIPYPESLASLLVITSDNIFVYSFILIAAIIILLSIFRYIKQKQILIFQSIADVVNLLLNENGEIKYPLLSRSEAFLIIPLTFAGFIIANGIFSILKSHLTRPFYQPQINTIQDIYQSDLNIFAHNEFYQNRLIQALNDMSGYDWSNRVRIQDFVNSSKQAKNFERISVLFVPKFYIPLLRAQKRLNIRGYQICRTLNPSPQLSAQTVNDAFPFTERFNDIIGRLKSSGLHAKWATDERLKVEQDIVNYNKNMLQKKTVIDKELIPIFVIYGWSASIILFFIELIWKHIFVNKISVAFD